MDAHKKLEETRQRMDEINAEYDAERERREFAELGWEPGLTPAPDTPKTETQKRIEAQQEQLRELKRQRDALGSAIRQMQDAIGGAEAAQRQYASSLIGDAVLHELEREGLSELAFPLVMRYAADVLRLPAGDLVQIAALYGQEYQPPHVPNELEIKNREREVRAGLEVPELPQVTAAKERAAAAAEAWEEISDRLRP